MPAIRPVARSLGLYQDPKAGPNPSQRDGGQTGGILRRHPSHGGVPGTSPEPHPGSNIFTGEPGVHCTPSEIREPCQETEFLGMLVNSVGLELKLSGPKIKNIRMDIFRGF